MTHRVFSRNSSSSRAIPIQKNLEQVLKDPVIPIFWGKNQKGMQAEFEISAQSREQAVDAWLKARDLAVQQAQILIDLKVHKQTVNRILEPWTWITVIITATEWDNFYNLRNNSMAQPEIQHIAKMMTHLSESSVPTLLDEGQWHLPFISSEDRMALSGDDLIKVCVGRCARVSYLTHDGRRDYQADIDLYNTLLSDGHMSPMEHAAMSESSSSFFGNFRGWKQHRKFIPNESCFAKSIFNKNT
jgi:thymidylate synthase ThyX